MTIPNWIEKKLEEKTKQNNYRKLKIYNYELCNNFASNDYLALSINPDIISTFSSSCIVGTCGSRLVSGESEDIYNLEFELSKYLKTQSSLVYSSGFLANLGLLSTIVRREDLVFSDKQIHASLIEGIRLSGAKNFRFEHNNLEHLELFLKRENANRKENQNFFIVVESLYSMSGDSPLIEELSKISLKYNCYLIIDEAHAIGVFDEGISKNIERENLIITATMSKAFGTYGGIVGGPKWLRELLINNSRSFIYNTALPSAVSKASLKALEIIKKNQDLGQKLLSNVDYFKKNLNFESKSDGQIIPIIIDDSQKTLIIADLLSKEGVYLAAIRPPTVEKALLRISITLHHDREKLLKLSQLINELV